MAGQKIRIRLKAYDHEVIDSSARKIVDTVTRTGARVAGPVPLPTEKNVYCVIRSPHKYKDSREHFEMRTHKRLIDIIDPTPKTVNSLMRLDLPGRRQHRDQALRDTTDMGKQLKGVLGTKLGMTQVFNDQGKVVPVTVVAAGPCVVTAVRTAPEDGYAAVQLGYGEIDPRRVTKPVAGHFAKAGVTPRRYLVELRTDDADQYTLGQEVTAETFGAGDLVDVTGRSKGKGTAGVMKRHGFHGLGASHGTQRKHRSPGSIGGCATPGRVFKGLKMAGRMGNARTTVPRLAVHAVDAERGLLLIKGAVPGPKGGLVLVRSAAKPLTQREAK